MGGTDWSLIGGNPAPGDVTSLDGAAGAVTTVRGEAANHLAQVQGLLSGWSGSGWSGAAADRFQELLEGVGSHLSQMDAAHDPIGRALAGYAAALSQQQIAADQALQRAVSAAAQEASASARRTAASEEHAQHAATYSQAASDLSRIDDAINQRLQQLASAGLQVLGDLTHIADSALQALLGEKQTAETAQAAAQEGMRIASGIIGEMDAVIADAAADLRGAISLADEVRSEVESSVQTAERTFGDVDNDLRDIWRHVQQDVRYEIDGTMEMLGASVTSVRRLADLVGHGVVLAAPEIHDLTRAWAESGDDLVDLVNDLGPVLPIACVAAGAIVGSVVPVLGTAAGAKVGEELSGEITADVEEFAAAGNLADAGSDELLKADGQGSPAELSQDMGNFRADGSAFVSDEVGNVVGVPFVKEGVEQIVDQALTTGHVNWTQVTTQSAVGGSEDWAITSFVESLSE
jgi:uncharacterized protein YukE